MGETKLVGQVPNLDILIQCVEDPILIKHTREEEIIKLCADALLTPEAAKAMFTVAVQVLRETMPSKRMMLNGYTTTPPSTPLVLLERIEMYRAMQAVPRVVESIHEMGAQIAAGIDSASKTLGTFSHLAILPMVIRSVSCMYNKSLGESIGPMMIK